ncbi:hypothetical protein [Herbaspirillum sp.]|uniref:hypothetical protein n=1 Tax=Herbaspirillum sp. TaxID=1890675 RepID=UPI00258FB25F|nr:hypothetical protein [Herbaspirillum sp.]MCP3947339.1 hypothetical protein [Herbaspirillum sp.]
MHNIAELARQHEQARHAAKIAADRVQTAATALAGAMGDALLADLADRGIVPGVKVTTNDPFALGLIWGFVGVERELLSSPAVKVKTILHNIKGDDTIGKVRSPWPVSAADLVLWMGDAT